MGSFEEAVDIKVMLDQLATHLGQRDQRVLTLLQRGYSLADASRTLGCSKPTVHRTVVKIKATAERIWQIEEAE